MLLGPEGHDPGREGRAVMDEHWDDKVIEGLFEYGPDLPLTLTADSSYRVIRLVGLLWYVVWVLPAFVICAIPLLLMIFVNIFMMTWRGEL
jgi:hypothetical protein